MLNLKSTNIRLSSFCLEKNCKPYLTKQLEKCLSFGVNGVQDQNGGIHFQLRFKVLCMEA